MTMMALTKHKIGVIVFSWGAGVMYSTLFTMPYLLVAHYHAQGVVSFQARLHFSNIFMLGILSISLNFLTRANRNILAKHEELEQTLRLSARWCS
jgi:Na+-driven multidrug efflux pump